MPDVYAAHAHTQRQTLATAWRAQSRPLRVPVVVREACRDTIPEIEGPKEQTSPPHSSGGEVQDQGASTLGPLGRALFLVPRVSSQEGDKGLWPLHPESNCGQKNLQGTQRVYLFVTGFRKRLQWGGIP